MDIGIAVHRYSPFEGTGGYVVRLVEELAAQHKFTVYAAEFDASVPAGVRTVKVRVPHRPNYATILTFPYVANRLMGKHDVVHAQGWTLLEADLVTTHIVMSAWRGAAQKVGALGRGERIFGARVQRMEAKLVCGAKRLITPSRMAERSLREDYGARAPIDVIPHGFPEVRARRREFSEPLIGIYVGDARKGLLPIIAAMGEERDFRLRVVSHSDSRPYLRNASLMGVADRIDWIGPSRDMAIHFDTADVLLHPSIYDTFGLVVAEAMAAGLPVITSRNCGISELITNGETGIVIEQAEGVAVREALATLRERGPKEIALAGQQLAAERPWSRVAQETEESYRMTA